MNTYSGRGLHGQVVNELGRRIMRGSIKPGEIIDPDSLLRDLKVSRTVLREALKVLGAKGLVDARPRLGTFVTHRSTWHLLDNDIMLWRTQDDPDPLLVVELGEVRQVIEPAAARMAAVRRTDEQLQSMEVALIDLEASAKTHGSPLIEADLRFHRTVLAAAGNELLEQFEVVLEPALHARNSLAAPHSTDSRFVYQHRAVFLAIRDKNPELARDAMQLLMDGAADDIEAILQADTAGKEVLMARARAF